MITIKEGFGIDDAVWAFTYGENFQIVPLGSNIEGDSYLEGRLDLLKNRDTPKYLGNVGVLLPHRFSNIKEIKQERILVEKFTSRKGSINEKVYYDKEFDVHVIYFEAVENVGFIRTN